jgi:hypothetical protein
MVSTAFFASAALCFFTSGSWNRSLQEEDDEDDEDGSTWSIFLLALAHLVS